jgi:hypothetical protein
MADQTITPHAQLIGLVNGFWVSQCLYVVAELRIADRLATRRETPLELAAETGANAPSLYRILRALASIGVFAEADDGRFGLTPMAEYLRTDAPDSQHYAILNRLRPSNWQAWGALRHTMLTGEPAFRYVHGVDAWEYFAKHPEERQLFDAGMRDISRALATAVVDAYDFGAATCVIDVGGGQGELLAAILNANPAARGILFEQPHVVNGAAPILHAAGVSDRCVTVAGSFFERVPQGDVYVLQHVIHNWPDEDAVRILRTCRDASTDSSRIVLSETPITSGNTFQPAKFTDLMMLISLDGARERTVDEYASLLTQAGFQLSRTIPTRTDHSLIEALPV